MSSFRPRLREAATASERMDALCEFIKFWLGPRVPSYGEPDEAIASRSLPMPLRKLYSFAGRWPQWNDPQPGPYAIPALAHQDALSSLSTLKADADGRLAFLMENQGNWNCLTLAEGDDPPVWCRGDQSDETGEWIHGERHVCDSLSKFLTTSVLQELTLGSRLSISDKNLTARFFTEQATAVPLWIDGPYVGGGRYNFYLWRGVMVANLWEIYFLAANHEEGITYLNENRGAIYEIEFHAPTSWKLVVRADGSAQIRYVDARTDESAETRPGTFEFVNLAATLPTIAAEAGHYERNAVVFFRRKWHSGMVMGKNLHDGPLVTSLFRLALGHGVGDVNILRQRFVTDWPL